METENLNKIIIDLYNYFEPEGDYNNCDDKLCDDESCILYNALKNYIKNKIGMEENTYCKF